MTNFILKFLQDKATAHADTAHADNTFRRENSATFSQINLLRNLHTVSCAMGSPKCMPGIGITADVIAAETKLGAPVQH